MCKKNIGNIKDKMCGCGKMRVPIRRQKMKFQMPKGETTAQVRSIQPNKRQQLLRKLRQVKRRMNEAKMRRKNMNSPFDHRYYLRF